MSNSRVNLHQLCILAVLGCLVMGDRLSIDFRASRVGESVFWMRVQMVMDGGSPPYTYSYTHLPQGWKQADHFLYIPAHHAHHDHKYVARLVVTDAEGEQLSASLMFVMYQGRVFVDGVAYPYEQEFSNVEPSGPSPFADAATPKIATATINVPNRPRFATSSSGADLGSSSIVTSAKETSPELSFDSQITSNTTFGSNGPGAKEDFEQNSDSVSNVEIQQPSHSTVSTFNDLEHLTPTTETSDEALNQKIQNILAEVQQQTYTHPKTIDEIFSKLPTIEELDAIILAVDILAISKTIQQVIVSQLDCNQKMAYLSEFFGRIQANVELKKLSLAKLKRLGQLAEEEVKRLEEEIVRLQNQIQAFKVKELKDKLQQQVIRLESAYQDYNNAVIENSLAQKRLPKFENKLKLLQADFYREKQIVNTLKRKKEKEAENIDRIRQQLLKAEKQYQKTSDLYTESEQKMENLEEEIKSAFLQAKQTSKIISDAPQALDTLKRTYLIQEVEVERIRQKIKSYTEKQIKLRGEIVKVQEQIVSEQQKISPKELQNGRQMVSALERNLPNIENQIDDLYYSCYEVEQAIISSPEGSYSVQQANYIEYLEKAYGLGSGEIFTNGQTDQEVLSLTHLTVYSNEWKQMYGQVILISDDDIEQVKQQVQVIENITQRQQDFICLRPSTVVSRVGVIKYINKNLMIVYGDDGNIYKLYLGSCTRIQSVKSRIPLIGDKIVFKGNQQAPLEFNIYSVSSF